MEHAEDSTFAQRAILVVFYGLAMAYFEAAVVVYLRRAVSIDASTLFPLRDQATLDGLGGIEFGREIATLVMLATVGWLAGRSGLERLAWMAVAFGFWDTGYYIFLWIFIDWPNKLTTYDLLFLVPVPWVAPVWAPIVVSVALITVGLFVARRVRRGDKLLLRLRDGAFMCGGGLVVIWSFIFHFNSILHGGVPTSFAWPVFVIGMLMAVAGATSVLGSGYKSHEESMRWKTRSLRS